MPPLRGVTARRLVLYAPSLHELGFKQHHVDGEVMALYAHFKRKGYQCGYLDAYYRASCTPTLAEAITAQGDADAIVVHLWTSDAYGPRLREIADELAAVRRTFGVPVIGFGPLAASAEAELVAHGAIDRAIGLGRVHDRPGDGTSGQTVEASIGRYLRGHTQLTTLTRDDLPYTEDAVISVSASRGCAGRCTFCAYNADLGGGWIRMPVDRVVADIAHLHRVTGATRFAFADSDFGGTRAACRERAAQLRRSLAAAGLAGRLSFSVNVRADTLDEETIGLLAGAGMRTMLIGVESFSDRTLHRLYGKRQDQARLTRIVRAADACGVTTVASYILWHPWQTLGSLHDELAAMELFGRYRIPQFMARSRLVVIPGTVMERKVRAAGLLETGRFERRFRFADPGVAALDRELAGWFEETVMPVLARLSETRSEDLTTLAELKMAEWQWLTARVAAPGAGAGHA